MPRSSETSTVTSKGQITIPKAIREALRLKPGDEVLFVPHHDGRVEMVARNLSVDDLIAALRAIVPPWQGPPVTVEEMNEGIGAAVAEEFARSVSEAAEPDVELPQRARAPRRRRAA